MVQTNVATSAGAFPGVLALGGLPQLASETLDETHDIVALIDGARALLRGGLPGAPLELVDVARDTAASAAHHLDFCDTPAIEGGEDARHVHWQVAAALHAALPDLLHAATWEVTGAKHETNADAQSAIALLSSARRRSLAAREKLQQALPQLRLAALGRVDSAARPSAQAGCA